jgi:hypothetical protein
VRVAIAVGVVVYAVTVFMGVYVMAQRYALQGILVLGLAACGLPLMIGWWRAERTRTKA